MSLSALPYDLLFNVAQYLAIDDIHNLQAVSRAVHSYTSCWLKLATRIISGSDL